MTPSLRITLKKLTPELYVKKENTSNLVASFLDLDINVKHKDFEIELYNKWNTFPFSIARMLYWDSNITTRIFYAALGTEILCFVGITSSKEKFQ